MAQSSPGRNSEKKDNEAGRGGWLAFEDGRKRHVLGPLQRRAAWRRASMRTGSHCRRSPGITFSSPSQKPRQLPRRFHLFWRRCVWHSDRPLQHEVTLACSWWRLHHHHHQQPAWNSSGSNGGPTPPKPRPAVICPAAWQRARATCLLVQP